MKSKLLLLFLALVLIVSTVAISCATPTGTEQVYNWKIQCAFGASDSAYYIQTKGVARLIEEGSGGRIKTETFPEGVLVGSDELFAAAQKGGVEMGVNMSSSVRGIITAAITMQLPTAARDLKEQMELVYDRGLINKLRPAFAEQGLYLLAMPYTGILAFQSTFPVRTLDDLKGKKVWVNATLRDGFAELGAVPTAVPGFDMYTALKLGTLDGMGWTVVELESAKYKEVVKYYLSPPLALAGDVVYVNMGAWNALGPELQKKVQDYVDKNIMALGQAYLSEEDKAIAEAKKYGVQFITLSDADIVRFNAVQRKYWDTIAAENQLAADCVQLNRDFLKSKGRL